MLYNPYNPKNRLIAIQDVERIVPSLRVRNLRIYQTAMVHSSYVKRANYTTPTGDHIELSPRPLNCLELFDESYERLEHLGDSILGTCVSTYLYTRFPGENEGFLSDLKKEIVCNETLERLSQIIGLNTFYIISRHNEDVCFGRTNNKKLGDILEAFIGAIWIDTDQDFNMVYNFVVGLIETYIDIPKLLLNNRNYKEQLQKLFQAAHHTTPTYRFVSCVNGLYTMAVDDVRGECMGQGSAMTKKQAEQLAAKEAITHFVC